MWLDTAGAHPEGTLPPPAPERRCMCAAGTICPACVAYAQRQRASRTSTETPRAEGQARGQLIRAAARAALTDTPQPLRALVAALATRGVSVSAAALHHHLVLLERAGQAVATPGARHGRLLWTRAPEGRPAPPPPAWGGRPRSPHVPTILAALAAQGPLSTEGLLPHVSLSRGALTDLLRVLARAGVLQRTPEGHLGLAMWWLPDQVAPADPPPRRLPVREDPLAPRNSREWTLARMLPALRSAIALRGRPLTMHELDTSGYAVPSSRACQRMLVRLGFADVSIRQAHEWLQAWALATPTVAGDGGGGVP